MRRRWALPAAVLAATLAVPCAAQQRVATLLPWVGDAFDRVGAGAVLVASVPAQSGGRLRPGLVDLGSPHAPSFELLATAAPDLLVVDRRLHAALAARLARLAPRLVWVDASSVDGTLNGLAEAARAAGVEADMAALVVACRRELDLQRTARPVRVLPIFGAPGSALAITDQTWLGDLLERLGFVNLAARLVGRESIPGYVELADEVVATLDPELVLFVSHGSPELVAEGFRREAAAGGVWGGLGERARVLDAGLFGRNPGLELGAAARALLTLVPPPPEGS